MAPKGNGGNGGFSERLLRLVEEADDSSAWRELAQQLRNPPKGESYTVRMERFLRVGKAMRDAGVLSDDEALYVIAHPIISISEDRMVFSGSQPALRAVSEKIQRVKNAHGIAEDEDWPFREGPQDYQELVKEWDRIHNEIIAATFEEYGEPEYAALYRQNIEKFHQRHENGRRELMERRHRH